MAQGPGKYDHLATSVREAAQADGVIVIVFNGLFGTGFSVQGPMELTANLPDILEQMAHQIRADMRSFTVSETPEGTAITCHACGMTSFNANDIKHRYCRKCNKFMEL